MRDATFWTDCGGPHHEAQHDLDDDASCVGDHPEIAAGARIETTQWRLDDTTVVYLQPSPMLAIIHM